MGLCVTGKAHYSPLAFSVNKNCITKNPHFPGKPEAEFPQKFNISGAILRKFARVFALFFGLYRFK